jgi:hypothetical protein
MPLQALKFKPGVSRDNTSLANEGGWFECDKVRFRAGYPEKIGGWVLDTGTALRMRYSPLPERSGASAVLCGTGCL